MQLHYNSRALDILRLGRMAFLSIKQGSKTNVSLNPLLEHHVGLGETGSAEKLIHLFEGPPLGLGHKEEDPDNTNGCDESKEDLKRKLANCSEGVHSMIAMRQDLRMPHTGWSRGTAK